MRADRASELPRVQTRRANQISVAALCRDLLILQVTQLRLAAVLWTVVFSASQLATFDSHSTFHQPMRIRLQNRLGKELDISWVVPVIDKKFLNNFAIGLEQHLSFR